MNLVVNVAALVVLALGMVHLLKVWRLHKKAPRSSKVIAFSGIAASIALFSLQLGIALGLIFGLFMVSVAGIAASAASADLGPPKVLARSAPRATEGLARARLFAGAWRFLLAVPIALGAGLAAGLAALLALPGADADRLVACTLVAITGAAALTAWTSSETRLWRATLIGAGSLALAVTVATLLAARS